MVRTTTYVTIAAATVVGSLLAYAAYFDYRRRNDIDFRKKLRKDHKKAHRTAKVADEKKKAQRVEDLKEELEKIKAEDVPTLAEERERYFMEHVGMGEQLSVQGAAFHIPAALSFYRALRVYPSPVELIMIYQKTVPEPIFKIVMDLTSMDVRERAEGYYEYFPPSSMNVEVKQVIIPTESPEGETLRKSILVARKDFLAGEEIYKEHPVVAALDMDLEGTEKRCSHCFREIQSFLSIQPPSDPLRSAYCSKECQLLASTQSQNLLFGTGPPVPGDTAPRGEEAERKAAQAAFVTNMRETGKIQPLLAARFLARIVAEEVNKLSPPTTASPRSNLPEPSAGSPSYTFYDHLERLKYLEVEVGPVEDKENEMVRELLKTAMAGLEEFVNEEKYFVLKGKMAFNAIGVTFAGGRQDRPSSKGRVEEWERFRTPYGSARQVGAALYRVSSYLNHSCDPSVRPSFPSGTNELHLVANRPISKGEELTMAYVNVHPEKNQSTEESRRLRRVELARGWRFACVCERCTGKKSASSTPPQKPEAVHEQPISGVPLSVTLDF